MLSGVYLDAQYFDFEEGKTYEIYFDCKLPEGVEPQFRLTNEEGADIEGTLEKITTTEGEGNSAVEKTAYKYSFTVESEGEYACIITFTHSDKNYKDISLQLNAWILIKEEA